MNAPWIQVSVDTQDIPSGLEHVALARGINAEWIEVGTPLLTFAGIDSIAAVKAAAGDAAVLADFKALDGVGQYFTRAGELGASIATVMAVANEASILKAIETGHAANVSIQVDMLNVPLRDMATRARELTEMGVDYFLLHLAIDELTRNQTADPLAGLDALVGATDLPIGPVVFTSEQGVAAVRGGASYVVVGYPHITEPDAASRLAHFATAVREA